jgi:uncharacterized membrane protein
MDEPTEAKTPGRFSRSETVRLEALSDGVIAVAITLLVLDLKVPHVGEGSLWNALVDQWPSYLAYATSFLMIGIWWLNHHSLFKQVRYATRALMLLNLVLLMLIVAIPFVTAMVADYLGEPGFNAKLAVALYNGLSLVSAIVIVNMYNYVLRRPELLEPEVDVEQARRNFPRFAVGSTVYLVLVGLSFINASVALIGTILVGIYYCFEHLPKSSKAE